MRVLIACEESQTVCKAFRELGHEAYSCDIQACSGGHPEWHIMGDVLQYLNLDWDLMIAHPPCTYLSRVAIQHNKKPGRLKLRESAIQFFQKLQRCGIPKICLENPVPQADVTERVGRWTQIIQPFYFGDPHMKTTCLWLKGLTRLHGLHEVAADIKRHKPKPIGYNGRGNPYYISGDLVRTRSERAKLRAKTFPGIARAMAEQWGGVAIKSKAA